MTEEKKVFTEKEFMGKDNGFLSDFFGIEEEKEQNKDNLFIEEKIDKDDSIFEIKKNVSKEIIVEKKIHKTQSVVGTKKTENTTRQFEKKDNQNKYEKNKKNIRFQGKPNIKFTNQTIKKTENTNTNTTTTTTNKTQPIQTQKTNTFTNNQKTNTYTNNQKTYNNYKQNNYNNTNRNYRNNITKQTVKPLIKKEKTHENAKTSSTLKKKNSIIISDKISIKEFSEKMGIQLQEVMKKLLQNKIILPATASIDYETANLIGIDFDIEVIKKDDTISIDDIITGNLQVILDLDKDSTNLIQRPPIVTIMGHVDHGKTTLLDYIRNSSIVESESGGITQSIGGSQIEYNEQKITFIDTPGHELFTSLRARGAKLTDIAIIVVAADDGVKQQTIEAINHAKDAGVPIIVAITKIDKPNSNIDIIKGQLGEQGLIPEEWGGDTSIVHLSAVTGQGVDELLEMILLQAEMLELKFNPERQGVGVVLEANKDMKKGVTTSIILLTGSIKVGEVIAIHNTFGKVRKMVNRKGEDITIAKGGDPIQILGIQELPEPGRVAEVMKNEKEANQKINLIKEKERFTDSVGNIQTMFDKISKGENVKLKLILKADSFGSLEALKYSITKALLPENIEIKIVHYDVGSITDSDISLAQASESVVIGFNIPFNNVLKKTAEQKKVILKNFSIIYEILDFVDKLLKGLIKIEEKEVVTGKLKVLGIFFKKGKEMILGGKVIEGKISNGSYFRIIRENEQIIGGGKITSLKRENDNVNEVNEGYECGMKVKIDKKPQENDILEFYVFQ